MATHSQLKILEQRTRRNILVMNLNAAIIKLLLLLLLRFSRSVFVTTTNLKTSSYHLLQRLSEDSKMYVQPTMSKTNNGRIRLQIARGNIRRTKHPC